MHALGPDQRHPRSQLTRRIAAAAGAGLAGCGLLAGAGLLAARAADASTPAGTVTLQPAPSAPMFDLQRFGVTGTVDLPTGQVVDVLVNGVQVGTVPVGGGDGTPFTFDGAVVPPAQGQPGALVCGANTVEIENPPPVRDPGNAVVATATLTAECPAITLDPATVAHAAEPAQVLVTGSLFAANNPVTVAVGGTQAATSTADDSGRISVPITAQGLACGTHQVTVTQQVIPDAGTPFTLTASAPLTVTRCQAPKLAIDPDVLEPGEVAQVTGSGFTPGKQVSLAWRIPGGGPPGTQTVTPGSKGTFTTSILVMLDAFPGPRVLVATQAGATVTANALIEGDPMQPSSGGQLVYRGG